MESYIGEIRIFAGTFAPVGWAFCDGQLMPISENDALFSLIGTTYGGDGQDTFALPDLRGRLPLHQGSGSILGESAGVEEVTLSAGQIPAHSHRLQATTSTANQSSPAGNALAQSTAADLYVEDTATAGMATASIAPVGGSQPHSNLQPYLCLNFIISLFGVYPSQT